MRRPARFPPRAAAVACTGGLILVGCSRAADFRPYPQANVLLVVVDVLRADHVGAYGYDRDTTPRIDALASGGVRFATAISSAGWTRPSISSLFTALDPVQHGVLLGFNESGGDFYLDALADDYTTLAEVLLANGWETVAVAPNAYTRPEFGFGQGFATYEPRAENARAVVDRFLEWLEAEPRGRFFAYLHFMDAHWPYDPPAPYATKFGTYPTTIDFDTVDWNELRQWVRGFRARLTEADLKQLIARHDGGIRFVDDELARLLDRLDAEGRLKDTIVVVTADHGEEFLENGRLGHGRHLYDYLLRVPLIWRWPDGWAAGTVIRNQVRLVDVMPTLLEAVGLRMPGEVSGHSLLELIRSGGDDPAMPPYAVSEHMRDDHLYRQSFRTERYKYIRSFYPRGGSGPGNPGGGEWNREEFLLSLLDPGSPASRQAMRELYDLERDPGERRNLLATRPDLVEELDGELDRWMLARRPWILGRTETKARIDPQTVEELRTLGYIQ